MDLYEDTHGHVWDCGPLGRRYITHPDVVAAFKAKGGQLGKLSDDALQAFPLIPTQGLPGWVWQIDGPDLNQAQLAALAQEIGTRVGVQSAATIAVATVHELGARLGGAS